jgi:hypothetical protein
MLAAWVQTSGGGSVSLTAGPRGVKFRVLTRAVGGDAALLDGTPMLGTLRQHVAVGTHARDQDVELEFTVAAAA